MTTLLTVDEVAERVGMSSKWVRGRISIWEKDPADPRGLPARNLGGNGNGKRWRVDPDVLDNWLRVAA